MFKKIKLFKFFTFSRKTTFGFLNFIISIILKMRSPLPLSSNPFL